MQHKANLKQNITATLIFLTLSVFAIFTASSITNSKKELFTTNKASTESEYCNASTSSTDCSTRIGCDWQNSTTCSQFPLSTCPSSKCYVRNIMRDCYNLSKEACESNTIAGCYPEYITGDCVNLRSKQQVNCSQWNNFEYQCNQNSANCKWVPQKGGRTYHRCGGLYVDAQVCAPRTATDDPFSICSTCATPNKCAPGTFTCVIPNAGNQISICNPNGCGYGNGTCPTGICHPPDAYNSESYCR